MPIPVGKHLELELMEGGNAFYLYLNSTHLDGAVVDSACLGPDEITEEDIEADLLSYIEAYFPKVVKYVAKNYQGRPGEKAYHPDMSGARLSGLHLPEADFRGAYLRGANLSNAFLHEANLTDADLSEADLSGAFLRRARLIDADLTLANLSGADLRNADLTEADLSGADLSRARLTDANLRGADLCICDLAEADLTGADLTGADLRGSNLTKANLSETSPHSAKWDERTTWPDGFAPKQRDPVMEVGERKVEINQHLAVRMKSIPGRNCLSVVITMPDRAFSMYADRSAGLRLPQVGPAISHYFTSQESCSCEFSPTGYCSWHEQDEWREMFDYPVAANGRFLTLAELLAMFVHEYWDSEQLGPLVGTGKKYHLSGEKAWSFETTRYFMREFADWLIYEPIRPDDRMELHDLGSKLWQKYIDGSQED